MSQEDRMTRAGDYVLGLMDEHERERAERDMEVDAEFRDCVLTLAERFHVFDRNVAPADVPADMWALIAARIATLPQMAGAELPKPAADAPSARRPLGAGRVTPRAYQTGGWRGIAVAASLFAAIAIGFIGGSLTSPSQEPIVVVVLADENNVPGAFVEAFANDAVRIVPLADFEVPPGKTIEMWTLYDSDVGPVSLGTFDQVGEMVLEGPSMPAPRAEQLYELTLEDAPGSPTGRPTGPILVKGLAVRPPR